jgi:hypothetical protein
MRKGDLAADTPIYFIIAVIVLALFVWLAFPAFRDVYAMLMKTFGLFRPSPVEEAIHCAYFRCVKGCGDTGIEDITWKSGTQTLNCNDFCKLPCNEQNKAECYTDTKYLTVCGDKSLKYPVNITLSSAQEINKDNLDKFNFDCCGAGLCFNMCISQEDGINAWDKVDFNGGCAINVEKAIISHKDEDVCGADMLGSFKKLGWKTATIKPDIYYITTSRDVESGGNINFNEIVLLPKDDYQGENQNCNNLNEAECNNVDHCFWCGVPAPSLHRCLDNSEAWICI